MMAVARCALRFALGLALLLSHTEGKLHSGSVVLGGAEADHRWQYLTKFGFGLGIGTYEIRLRLKERPGEEVDTTYAQFQLEAFLDEDWARAESMPICRRALDAPARGSLPLQLGLPGQWGPWQGGQVAHVVRSHIWYFAISSCYGIRGDPVLEIDYELRMRQFDDSEMSVEMMYMPAVSAFALVCLTAFLGAFAARCCNYERSAGAVHPVIRVLAVAVVLQWAAEAFNTLNLFYYRKSGLGLPLADGLAEVCFMLSQVLNSTLLIAIAHGYTLRHSSFGQSSLLRPTAIVLAVFHVLLVGLDKVQGESSDKHHENEGLVGWAILLARVLLYAWFVTGVQAMQQKGGFKLQNFLQRFQLAGSAYFLAHPVIFIIVQAFAPYLQHPIMEVGMLTMQTTSAVWLADLFLSRGAYFEVSHLSSSLLPGGTGTSFTVGLGKDD